jgi:hypothetical protein
LDLLKYACRRTNGCIPTPKKYVILELFAVIDPRMNAIRIGKAYSGYSTMYNVLAQQNLLHV